MATQKLELTWIGKEKTYEIEPRILIENPNLSYEKVENLLDDGTKDNMLIHGDNLLALEALRKKYSSSVKCIYIDPPYNTGSAFEHYDDNVEHSMWLSLMRERLLRLKDLLTDDGIIYIQIDDIEHAYLKVLCDEIFGRSNYITSIAVKMSTPSGVKLSHRDKKILKVKEYIVVYAKNKDEVRFNPQYFPKTEWDPYYEWYVDKNGTDVSQWKVYQLKEILAQNGIIVKKLEQLNINDPKVKEFYLKNADKIWQRGRNTNIPKDVLQLSNENWETVFEYGNDEDGKQYCYKGRRMAFLANVIKEVTRRDGTKANDLGTLICDFWDDISTAALFSEGKVDFPNGKKPETLIQRILDLSTEPGDLVLDSFLGSGSTCAVAQKMGRRWIGIEMGEHAYTHCKKRIDMVINGQDLTGITKARKWKGGGGYHFYELAPTLINEDLLGEPIINKEYNPDMLAAAVALHEGFKYCPNPNVFWKQSVSTENSYLFVTTAHLSDLLVKEIEKQMSEDEFLLIACKSFDKSAINISDKIKIKKIPQMLLGKCEFGKDDYSLNIINPPVYEYEEDDCDE